MRAEPPEAVSSRLCPEPERVTEAAPDKVALTEVIFPEKFNAEPPEAVSFNSPEQISGVFITAAPENATPVLSADNDWNVNDADVLKADYIEENIVSDNLTFTLPYGTDPDALKSLVPSFSATEGASVNVADESGAPDGKDIISGQTAIDFSSDVRLVVFLKNNYKAYTVSVKIAEPAKWAKVAETSMNMKSDPVLAIASA